MRLLPVLLIARVVIDGGGRRGDELALRSDLLAWYARWGYSALPAAAKGEGESAACPSLAIRWEFRAEKADRGG